MLDQNILFELEDITSLQMESKFESPYTTGTESVPRVTSVISKMIEEPGIPQWANSLGFKHKGYKKELERICAIGTQIHEQINGFLSGKPYNPAYATMGLQAFMQWYGQVSQLGIEILGLEESLVGETYGGTYDALLKIGGKVWLIDFKSSNKVGYKYFIQLAAYAKLLRDIKNIEVDGCLILQLSKYHPSFLEFVLDMHYEPHREYLQIAERTFESLLYGYYHISYLEGRFKNEWPNNYKYLSERK